MAKTKGKRSRAIPARYWLRYGVKALAVVVRIVLIWLDLGD